MFDSHHGWVTAKLFNGYEPIWNHTKNKEPIMRLTVEIPETDVIKFGRESVLQEMENTIKWMKIKQSFGKISKELKSSFDEQDYFKTLEEIRESAWNEYGQNLMP